MVTSVSLLRDLLTVLPGCIIYTTIYPTPHTSQPVGGQTWINLTVLTSPQSEQRTLVGEPGRSRAQIIGNVLQAKRFCLGHRPAQLPQYDNHR